MDAQMRGQLLLQASHVAQTMNPELVRQLSFSAADNGAPPFEYLREQMTVYGHYINQKSIWSLTLRNDTLIFGPDNVDVNDPLSTPPGTVYEKPLPGILEIFKTGKPYVIGPYTDEYGTFVSAIAPVTDPQSGKVLMVVAVDVMADDWQARLNAARLEPFFTVFILMLVLLAGFGAIRWRDRYMRAGTLDLKFWIIAPVALAMLAGLILFGVYQYQQGIEASNLEMQRVTERADGEWNRLVTSEVQMLKAQIDQVSKDPVMLKAWQDHDLTALAALVQPVSDHLKSDYKITHFYFVDLNRTVFFRGHQPERRGDRIDRVTMLMAERTGDDTWGVELGPLGTLTLRYVRPVIKDGTIIGYIELGEEVNYLADAIAQGESLDTIAILRKEYLTRENFEAGRPTFGFTGQWDTYPDFVVAHQTSSKIPAEIDKWLKASHAPYDKTPEFTAQMDGKKYSAGIIYLPDAAGRNVGDIILMQDVTAQSGKAESDLFFNMGLVIILFGSILVLLWMVTDTTERQLTGAFETVTRTRRNFEVFFNTIEDFLFVLDEQGCILHTNETVTRRLGYTKEELPGQSVLMMHPPDRRDEAGRTVAGMLAGTIDFCPVPLMTKDGRLIPVETRVTRGEWDGTPVLFGVSKDISDLKKSEEKFSAAFHANPALMIVSTIEDGRILDVNASFLATLGYSREEVMGKTVSELDIYSDSAQRNTFIRQLKESGQIRNVEVKIYRKDRELVDGLFSAITIDVSGVPRLFTVVLDITERKQNESVIARKTQELLAVNDELTAAGEELKAQFDALTTSEQMVRESEEKFRLLIENSHDIIYTITPAGIITFVSPSWTALLGQPVNEVEGRSFQQFIHPDDLPAFLTFLQKTIETAQRQTGIEYRVRHADGTWRLHTTNAVPLKDESGTVIAFEGSASDITERKRAEDALLQASRKLAMLNSITRHDILNQLMGLRTYLELSRMDVSDPVFLNYIQKEEQAAEAIQWQIEFTKNYQDIGGQAPKWQNLSDTIGSAVSQLKPTGVEINVAVERAEVFADPLLEKVFYNLMENSLRHGEHVTRMDFSVKESESGLILTYADNGVGVTADDKKKLFQKGFGKHTGLGLFLSKEILSITGITIREIGEPGKGARFEMTVPKGIWRTVGNDA
jgi:PAS domain S-box-containing protein